MVFFNSRIEKHHNFQLSIVNSSPVPVLKRRRRPQGGMFPCRPAAVFTLYEIRIARMFLIWSWSLSAIRAMNSELVGLPLALLTV